MDDLVAAGVTGIMVCAVDPKTMTDEFDRIGNQVALFTTDSDAPKTNRVAYIGSTNVLAGKQAGEIAKKAMPNGGKCMGFVGLLGADNARERIQGIKDTLKGTKIELVDVRTDDIDQTRAKRNVEDTLTAHPEINCMVGFYSYNTPQIYEALKEAGKLGKITIVGFDDDPVTLGGVKEGTIAGTVVQQPFEWGYQGMKDMATYLEGDKSSFPRTVSSSSRPRSSARTTSTPSGGAEEAAGQEVGLRGATSPVAQLRIIGVAHRCAAPFRLDRLDPFRTDCCRRALARRHQQVLSRRARPLPCQPDRERGEVLG